MPKVSVIVPTFNRAAYLEKVIKSIIDQDFNDYEIIVTDNDSTDNTEEIVKGFALANIVYCKNEQNFGMIVNHNKSLELATGEYIHIFSDDDVMKPGSISKKVAILDAYANVGLVHSDIEVINGDDEVISGHWANSYYDDWVSTHYKDNFFKGIDYFKILYYHWNIISMPSVMIRSSTLKKAGDTFNPNLKFAMDLEMWMRLCLFGDVFYLNETLVQYRIHSSNNILKENVSSTYDEFLLIKKVLFEKYGNIMRSAGINENEMHEATTKQLAKYPIVEIAKDESGIQFVKKRIASVISKVYKYNRS